MSRWTAVALALLVIPASAADRRPNVVVISIDDMAYADLGCYGGKLAPTPHCDSLAQNGTRFTDAYAAGYATAIVGKWHLEARIAAAFRLRLLGSDARSAAGALRAAAADPDERVCKAAAAALAHTQADPEPPRLF